MPGSASSRANGIRASSSRLGRARCGCWNRESWSRGASACLPGRSASNAAGGTATTRSATTSLPSLLRETLRVSIPSRSDGSTAKAVNGTCMASLPDYAELHCLSNFSFLRGASHPGELVERAKALGYRALALTDKCSMAGAVRAHQAAKECGLKLILGTEVSLQEKTKLLLLASARQAYGAISSLITAGRRRSKKGAYSLSRADLEAVAGKGVLVLWVPGDDAGAAPWIKEHFSGDAWIAAELHCGPNDAAKLKELQEISRRWGLPLVAAGDVHMHVRSRRRLQDVLTAVRLGKPLAECGQALYPNAERSLRLRVRLAQLYPEELLAATVAIAARCEFSLDELRYEYPEELVP